MTTQQITRRPRLRVLLFRLHAWLGLHAFMLYFAMFLSGTLIVFIAEIEALGSAPMRAVGAGEKSEDFGAAFEALRTARPDARPLIINRSETSWIADSIRISTANGQQTNVWTDPVTGLYLGEADVTLYRRLVRSFHASFVTDKEPGGLLASALSLPLIFFIVTGLLTYRRFWRGFFRAPPRDKGRRAFWGGMHRLVALWSLPFLGLMALTGAYFFVSHLGVGGTQYPSAAPVEARTTALPQDFDGAALDRAAAVARAALPGLHITRIDLPRGPTDPIRFYGPTDAVLVEARGNGVFVDPVSLAVLGQYHASDLSFTTRLTMAVEQLHYGHWGGVPIRVLWLVFGVLACLLTWAGAMIFAARLAEGADPDLHRGGALGRVWAGMSVLKWGLVLFFIAVTALALLRHGPF